MTDPIRSAARAVFSTTVVVLGLCGAARAQDAINLDYDFYGNGIRVLTLGFDAMVAKKSYQVRYALRTKGLASLFSDSTTISTASGAIVGNRIKPAQFDSESDKDDEKKLTSITWRNGRMPETTRSYHHAKYKIDAINRVLRPGTPDPFSAMLQATLFDAANPCRSAFTVYDGKHVFELRYSYLGPSKVASGNGLYAGPAYKCALTYTPIAGLSLRKTKKALDEPQPPFTVWLAPFRFPGHDQDLLIPVHATGQLKWANLDIYLRKARVSGSALAPSGLAKN